MAITYEAQVEALTGITISSTSNPTQTELSSFLVDGVMDVVNRTIRAKPEELHKFTLTTNSTTTVTKKGQVLSVVREHDSTSILRPCTKISPQDRYEATDVDSLKYRSKYNPGWYELDKLIYAVPTAGSGNNDIVVTQVEYDTGLVFSDTYNAGNILYFPLDYEHLVALYAAIRTVQAHMGSIIISVTSVPPDMPSVPSFTASTVGAVTASANTVTVATAGSLGTAPTYTAPVIGGATEELTITMDAGTIGSDKTDFSKWWDITADYIEDQEDTELAGAQLQKITTYLSAYAQAMQNKLNVFNEASVAYQATVQEALKELDVAAAAATKDADIAHSIAIKNADLARAEEAKNADLLLQKEMQEYSSKLQKYSADVGGYQAEVNTEVQEKTNKMQQYQLLYAQLKREYDSAFIAAAPEASE